MKYTLYENHLPAAQGTYSARIPQQGSVDITYLAKRIVEGGSTVTESDLVASLLEVVKIIKEYLGLGFRIDFGTLCHFYPRVSGAFTGPNDAFDHNRHTIFAGATMDKEIKEALNKLTMEKIERTNVLPVIELFIDSESETVNTTMTAGSTATITGKRLRFDKTQSDEGAFLVDSADPTEEVRCIGYIDNNPRKVSFLMPATPLTSAEGFVEIRTRLGVDGGPLEVFRFGKKMTQV